MPAAAAAMWVALLAAAAVAPAAAVFPCCANIVTKAPYADCTCLEDDTWRTGDVLQAGESRWYHWRLTDWSIINVPDEDRPDISFNLRPCTGAAELHIKPLQPPFPNSGTARWSSEYLYEPNIITTKLVYSEYLITVSAATATNYSIAAIIDATQVIVPGADGAVAALPIQDDEKILFEGDTMSMTIQFTAASRAGAEYRVYAAKTGDGSLPCQKGAQRSGCLLSTPCGLDEGGMEPQTGWVAYTAGEEVNVLVDGLEQNQPYYFNVAVRHNGRSAAYVATQGTPTYLRVTQAQDDGTVLIVALVAGGLFVILVVLIIWARVRLQKAYNRRHTSRTAQRYRNR